VKNQNDLIGLIVAIVVGLGGILTFFFMKPTPPTVAAPTAVSVTDAKLSEGAVTYTAALPGGSSGGMGGGMAGGMAGGFGGPSMGGSRGGPGGPPPGAMGAPAGGGGPSVAGVASAGAGK